MGDILRGAEYFKPLLDIVILLLQGGLLIAAVWLARETQQLRLRTSDQVRLLYDQARRASTPQLFFEVKYPDAQHDHIRLVATNLGDEVAFNLDSWYYEHANRNFQTCYRASPYIGKGETESLIIATSPRYTPEEAIDRVVDMSKYDQTILKSAILRDVFTHDSANYALLLFTDRDGRVFALRRKNADIDGADVAHFFEL